jgi:hypothetical protein
MVSATDPALHNYLQAQVPVNAALRAGQWSDFYSAMTALAEHPLCSGGSVKFFWDGYRLERRRRGLSRLTAACPVCGQEVECYALRNGEDMRPLPHRDPGSDRRAPRRDCTGRRYVISIERSDG